MKIGKVIKSSKNQIAIRLNDQITTIPQKGDGLLIIKNNKDYGFEISQNPIVTTLNHFNKGKNKAVKDLTRKNKVLIVKKVWQNKKSDFNLNESEVYLTKRNSLTKKVKEIENKSSSYIKSKLILTFSLKNKFPQLKARLTLANHKAIEEETLGDKAFEKPLKKSVSAETVKKQLTTHLVNILQDSVGVDIGHTIGTAASAAISKAVSVAVAMNISTTVIAAVLKQVAFALKGVIAKVLATTAFKTTIVAFLKKLMAIKIVTALAAIVAAVPVLGPAIATAPLWVIVAPVLAGFIYYQVSNLPGNMGEKVSEAVCKELNGKFEQLNTDVVTQILENFSKDTLGTLVKDIAKEVSQNITFRNSLNEIE